MVFWQTTSKHCTKKRAARSFFLIQPIKSLIWGVVVDVVAVKSLPFPVQGVPHWRVKSSGVRQSKIYTCPERSFGSKGVKLRGTGLLPKWPGLDFSLDAVRRLSMLVVNFASRGFSMVLRFSSLTTNQILIWCVVGVILLLLLSLLLLLLLVLSL